MEGDFSQPGKDCGSESIVGASAQNVVVKLILSVINWDKRGQSAVSRDRYIERNPEDAQ